jgi:hypothetical protein
MGTAEAILVCHSSSPGNQEVIVNVTSEAIVFELSMNRRNSSEDLPPRQ